MLRDDRGLREAGRELDGAAPADQRRPCTEAWEATNLHLVATALAGAALQREETRGVALAGGLPRPRRRALAGAPVTRLADGAVSMHVGGPPT